MSDWNESKLVQLINEKKEEEIHLEYKAAESLAITDGKKKELTKDVSAMSNADGGCIIYGIKEFDDVEREHLPEKITPIDRTRFPKEWIEQIINSNIQPRIQGIIIHSIQLSSGANDVAYVVEVPKSTTAHQAKDFRYYRRYNFQVLEMYDHEIRDVMNRLKYAEFEIFVDIQKRLYLESDHKPSSFARLHKKNEKISVSLELSIKNMGPVYAKYVNCHFIIPSVLLKNPENDYACTYILDNTVRDVVDVEVSSPYYVRNKYGPSWYKPLLPFSTFRLNTFDLVDNVEEVIQAHPDRNIVWLLFADNAPEQKGDIPLSLLEVETIDERGLES